MFLRDHAPEVLRELARGLALVTTHVSAEYLVELSAFDELIIRTRLDDLKQNRITMRFEYWKLTADGEELTARGEQQVACMRREGARMISRAHPEGVNRGVEPLCRNLVAP